MKLRLTPTSIRLRLDPDELSAFAAATSLTSRTPLPGGGEIGFGVAVGESTDVHFADGCLQVTLSRAAAAPLLAGQTEGVQADVEVGTGELIRLIVERDRGGHRRP